MTTVKSVIEKLQRLNPDEHILFDYFTKREGDEVLANKFDNDELEMSQEAWLNAVDRAENWYIGLDEETLREAVIGAHKDVDITKVIQTLGDRAKDKAEE